jgi:UDP-2,3-diacylglucosamine pyrophosphatase LpxH
MKSQKNILSDQKIVLVISDIHLGGGLFVFDQKNNLEDFLYDQEMVDFLNYYSSDEYELKDVEIVINGDFLDFLAIPFVNFYDDEFWSEKAALAKLEKIYQAHYEVFNALSLFCKRPLKKVTYIIGNHDAEIIFPQVQRKILSYLRLSEQDESFRFILDSDEEYRPHPNIVIRHGHQYELAHLFHKDNLLKNDKGELFFMPPWGSYYVIRVVNKFKFECEYINAVRPIRKFLINGIIYDTFFTLRFIFANVFYFVMVRTLLLLKQGKGLKNFFQLIRQELELFTDYQTAINAYFEKHEEVRCYIVGHTHYPHLDYRPDGKIIANSGTWTNMYSLDIQERVTKSRTYIKVTCQDEKEEVSARLLEWVGQHNRPYR